MCENEQLVFGFAQKHTQLSQVQQKGYEVN